MSQPVTETAALHFLVWSFCFGQVLTKFKSLSSTKCRFLQLSDGESSACEKHPSVHVCCLSYGCRVNSSVYKSFHARFDRFSFWLALNCRITESSLYRNSCLHILNWACTFRFAQVLANFKSSSLGDARFVQLADSGASACRKDPSVHIGSSSCSCTVDNFLAPISSCSILGIQAVTRAPL